MKNLILTLLLTCSFLGCEFIDLESKRVKYSVDTQETYSHQSSLIPGVYDSNRYTIGRSSFDIPDDAEIDFFLIKNIFIDVYKGSGNDCEEVLVGYALGRDEFAVNIDISNSSFEQIFVNNNFSIPFTELRTLISEVITRGQSFDLLIWTRCTKTAALDVSIVVNLGILAEYESCESLPKGTDLPDC